MTRLVVSLSEIPSLYNALFVDLWGCVHDGLHALPEAVTALEAYRANGGIVVLVTNSPKPRDGVEKQLLGFGVPEDCWDTIATSGDSARAAMFLGAVGRKIWFMGDEERDAGFLKPLAVIGNPVEISCVPFEEAEGIVCCAPFDPYADPAVNQPRFAAALARGMKLLCANPDIVVDRGGSREWCAGALAHLYTEMGGESLYFGKPHAPIYDLARLRLTHLGHSIANSRILAIGDGLHTDIAGGIDQGMDTLFVSGGLAAAETGTPRGGQPNARALSAFLSAEDRQPTYTIGHLR